MKYFSIIFLVGIILMAFLFPFIFTYNPHDIDLSKSFTGPSWSHLFGLDENGKDLLIQVIYGSRISLIVTFSTVSVSFLIGFDSWNNSSLFKRLHRNCYYGISRFGFGFPKISYGFGFNCYAWKFFISSYFCFEFLNLGWFCKACKRRG